MQDIISKMSDTDIKPMVDPSPPRDTIVNIADGGTPPLDDTTYDLQLRLDTHPENIEAARRIQSNYYWVDRSISSHSSSLRSKILIIDIASPTA